MAVETVRIKLLRDLIACRIVVLDGAFGTSIQDMNLSAADFGGPELEGCNENLVRTRHDCIRAMHEIFLDAGTDIIETASFGSTPLVLAEYQLQDHAREISRLSAKIARDAAHAAISPHHPPSL